MGRLPAVVVRTVPAVFGAIAIASCAQIAGIEDTNGNARPIDSVAVTRLSIGATPTSAPLDLGGLMATYFVPDAASQVGFDRVMADAGAMGTWTTKLYAPAPVEFTLPDAPAPIPRLFAFPSHQLKVLYGVLEHPSPAPAPDGATFTVTAKLDAPAAATDSFQTYVVGAWLARGFAAGEVPVGATSIGPVTYGFTAANSVASHPKPDQVTSQDAFLILRYAAGGLTGVAEPATPVDQTGAATMVTTQAMVPVAQDQTLDVKIAPAMLTSRYSLVRPAVGGLAMSWNLVAAPGYQTASTAGPLLHSGSLTPTDVGVNLKYGNPFAARGWNAMFVLMTSESRGYTAPGTMASLPLVAGMTQYIEPSPGFELKLPAGLPILVKLDGALLAMDGQVVKLPSKLVHVTFDTDTPGGASDPSATLYELQVWDLVPDATAATTLDRHFVYDAVSSEASFDLPPEVFQVGHSYTLRAVATLGGYPAIAGGDLVMRALPLAQSYLDSPVITVMAP